MIGHPFILILVDRSRDGRPRIMAHAYTPVSGASYIYDYTSLYFDDIRPHSVYSQQPLQVRHFLPQSSVSCSVVPID